LEQKTKKQTDPGRTLPAPWRGTKTDCNAREGGSIRGPRKKIPESDVGGKTEHRQNERKSLKPQMVLEKGVSAW